MTHMRAELLGRLNAEAAAQGVDPVTEIGGDVHEFFDRWITDAPPMRQVATYGDLRCEPRANTPQTTPSSARPCPPLALIHPNAWREGSLRSWTCFSN
jgi:hypothetical protein